MFFDKNEEAAVDVDVDVNETDVADIDVEECKCISKR